MDRVIALHGPDRFAQAWLEAQGLKDAADAITRFKAAQAHEQRLSATPQTSGQTAHQSEHQATPQAYRQTSNQSGAQTRGETGSQSANHAASDTAPVSAAMLEGAAP